MAERRMFAKTIIDSDAFLDMPLTTQALYFHLSMRADDDGFLNNAQKIIRMISASKNDYDLLLVKKFIIQFEDGICVIKHWRIHNYIRSDRYKPTMYQDKIKSLAVDCNKSYKIKENNLVINKNNDASNSENNAGIPDDNQMDTQVRLGKDRLDKVSIGKVRLEIVEGRAEEDNLKESNREVEANVNLEKYNLEDKVIGSSKNIKTRSKSEEDKRSNRDKADRITKVQLNEIKNKWNSLGLSKVISFKNNRLRILNARIREYGISEVFKAIDNINNSKFLKGDNNKGWLITFDWFIKPSNFTKVLEGNYIDKNKSVQTKFNDYEQRSYDYDDLEKRLLGWDKTGES